MGWLIGLLVLAVVLILVAGRFGFQHAEFFEVEVEAERAPIEVQF